MLPLGDRRPELTEKTAPSEGGDDRSDGHSHPADHGEHAHTGHERLLSFVEAVLLSVVALVVAWSGYSSAEWGTRSSDLLARSLETQSRAEAAGEDALQLRTFDSVSFDAAFSAYVAHDRPALQLAIRRQRPEYRSAFDAWLALRPLKNPNAPRDPSLMPQYRLPQEAHAHALRAEAHASFKEASAAGSTSDKYVRLTVILASVLFLIGISGHFPARTARYALIGIGCLLIAYSFVELLTLPGPPT
jgi:hypothetical protein